MAASTAGSSITVGQAAIGATVDLATDPHCQRTGTDDTGGALISCNVGDAWGQGAPGQTQLARRGSTSPRTHRRTRCSGSSG